MNRLRSSRFAAVLGLCLGVVILFPEIGHGLAHHFAAAHQPASAVGDHHADRSAAPHVSAARMLEPVATDHPHLDLLVSPPVRPQSLHAVVVSVPVLAAAEHAAPRAAPSYSMFEFPPGDDPHGPQPHSRAPPLD